MVEAAFAESSVEELGGIDEILFVCVLVEVCAKKTVDDTFGGFWWMVAGSWNV